MSASKLQPGYEVAQVMITVKTYPSPSDRYGETVCVAGVRLDREPPEWVRLYPMKFRLVDYEQQFKKYEIVEIPVAPQGTSDPRPESMRPDQSILKPLRQVDTKRNWAERRQLLGDLVGATTTCDLIAANNAVTYADAAPSLGLVKVLDVDLKVSLGDPWDDRQQAKVVAAAAPSLFNQEGLRELEPAPYKLGLRYRCEAKACRGHQPTMIDWEMGQAGRKWRRESGDARAREMLLDKYTKLFGDDIDTHLFIGNMHQHRASFSALGVWGPKAEPPSPYEGDLFS